MQLFIDCQSMSDIYNAAGRGRALCRRVAITRGVSYPSRHLVAGKNEGTSPQIAQKVVLEGGTNLCHRDQAPELKRHGLLCPFARCRGSKGEHLVGELKAVMYVGDWAIMYEVITRAVVLRQSLPVHQKAVISDWLAVPPITRRP